MLESTYADAFLSHVFKSDATLVGASALGSAALIYKHNARQATAYPCLVFDLYDAGDVNTANGVRLFTRPVYRVRVVGKVLNSALQDAARFRVAANRADELLKKIERVTHEVEGVTFNFNTWRESELPPPREVPGESADVFYRYAGGLYRVECFE